MGSLSVLPVLTAFSLGLFVVWRFFRSQDYDEEKVLDLVFLSLVAAVVAGKGVFVAWHWEDFSPYPLSALNLFDGGFNWVIAVLAFLLLASYRLYLFKWPFLPPLEFLVRGLMIVLVVLTLWGTVETTSGVLLTTVLFFVMIVFGKMSTSKEALQQEEKQLQKDLKGLEAQDPKNRPQRLAENAPEEEGDEAEAGSRVAAIKGILVDKLRSVRQALKDLRRGNYGICDKCGEKIDPARLKAVPEAQYCLACERQLEEQSL